MFKFLLLISLSFVEYKPKNDQVHTQETDTIPSSDSEVTMPDSQGTIKIMSYNIRHGEGMDEKVDLNRIANVISKSGAEIISLNEVDRNYSSRSSYVNQIVWLANKLGMNYEYQATTTYSASSASGNKPREDGHALLSKYPILSVVKHNFTDHDQWHRGLMETKIDVDGDTLYFYVTHLGLEQGERLSQMKETLKWMGENEGNKVIAGDFNAYPRSIEISAIKSRFHGAFSPYDQVYTFNSSSPTARIDYFFGSSMIEFIDSKTIRTLASDHLPIVSDIKMNVLPDSNVTYLYPLFPESFEGDVEKKNYMKEVIRFKTGNWNLDDAIIGDEMLYDRPTSGVRAIRMQGNLNSSAFLQMNFDVPDGASEVKVKYGMYFNDEGSDWRLEYSTDSGVTWKKIGSAITDAAVVKKTAVFKMDIKGKVRFRINKIGRGKFHNGKLSIDDFAVYRRH